jgi:hypothetical protein
MSTNVEPKYVSQKIIAKLFDIPERTLEAWRMRGQGPPFQRAGERLVRYKISDVESWMAGEQHAGTRVAA